jgi:hypothetical protein
MWDSRPRLSVGRRGRLPFHTNLPTNDNFLVGPHFLLRLDGHCRQNLSPPQARLNQADWGRGAAAAATAAGTRKVVRACSTIERSTWVS